MGQERERSSTGKHRGRKNDARGREESAFYAYRRKMGKDAITKN
jgi:hypothetical protein